MGEIKVSFTSGIYQHNSRCAATHVSTIFAGRKLSYKVGVILGFIAAVLFLFGVCLILIFWRTKLHNPSQVVISSIPDEDLENFPAPILPSNHVPHRLPVVVKACSVGLPD